MARSMPPVYFADENALGFGKLLRARGRSDVVYPGHEDLPEVPLSTPDVEWMKVVASLDLIVVTRERHIRTRPAELLAYREFGIRSVRIGSKKDLTSADQVELFERNEFRVQKLVIKLGPGPWALVMNSQGVKEIRLREE